MRLANLALSFGIFFGLFLSAAPRAHALDYPVFEAMDESQPADDNVTITLPSQSVDRFNVLVFPHLGKYGGQPQLRESNASAVSITTTAPCEVHEAVLNEKNEWKPNSTVIGNRKTMSQIALTGTKLAAIAKQYSWPENETHGIYYSCPGKFTVHRANKNLKAFTYTGDFVLALEGKQIQIIQIVDPEEYIKGVVPSEMPASWPMEALKVQAVAARTYAWWTVLSTRNPTKENPHPIIPYDMDDTVMFQAYRGVTGETEMSNQAAAETKGLVMKYKGQVIKAYFSADSGGFTEDAKPVYGFDLKYCQATKEEYDSDHYVLKWTVRKSIPQIVGIYIREGLLPAGIQVKTVAVGKRTASGRVDTVIFTTKDGHTYEIPGPKFQYGASLKSTFFDLKQIKGGGLQVTGVGWGAGVGMSQKGALAYAKLLGWSFDKILKFYYTGIQIISSH